MSHMEVLNSQVRNFSLVDQRSTFLGAEASVWSEGIDSRKEYISYGDGRKVASKLKPDVDDINLTT